MRRYATLRFTLSNQKRYAIHSSVEPRPLVFAAEPTAWANAAMANNGTRFFPESKFRCVDDFFWREKIEKRPNR